MRWKPPPLRLLAERHCSWDSFGLGYLTEECEAVDYFSASFSEESFSLFSTNRFKIKKTTPMIIKMTTTQLKPATLIALSIKSVISLKANIGESIIKVRGKIGRDGWRSVQLWVYQKGRPLTHDINSVMRKISNIIPVGTPALTTHEDICLPHFLHANKKSKRLWVTSSQCGQRNGGSVSWEYMA